MKISLHIFILTVLSLTFISNIQAQNNPPELSGIGCGIKYSDEVHAFETMKMKICSHDEDGDSVKFLWFRSLNGQPDSLLWEIENGSKLFPVGNAIIVDTTSSTRPSTRSSAIWAT